MKKTAEIAAPLAFFLIITAMLLSVIDYSCFRKEFYRKELEKNDTTQVTGMDAEGVLESTYILLDYLKDVRDDIIIVEEVNGAEREVFNERETLHMIDVKALYRNALTARNLMAAAGAVLLGLSWWLSGGEKVRILRQGLITALLFMLGIVAFIGIWAVIDFYGFWTNFHMLFFDNDLWLLDPRTSIMINLLPGGLFFDLVTGIILRFTACMAVLAVCVFGVLPKLEKRQA